MVDPLSYFSFQPALHDWCNKGCGMCYPVCGMMHIKEPLLLIYIYILVFDKRNNNSENKYSHLLKYHRFQVILDITVYIYIYISISKAIPKTHTPLP